MVSDDSTKEGGFWEEDVEDQAEATEPEMTEPEDQATTPDQAAVAEEPAPEVQAAAAGTAETVSDQPAPPRDNRLRNILIAAAVLLLVMGFSVKAAQDRNAALDAQRKAVDATLADVKNEVQLADDAAEPGSQEMTELENARGAIVDAEADLREASFFNTEACTLAAQHAEEASGQVKAILARVSGGLQDADAKRDSGDSNGAMKAYFAFYKQYPHTVEAQTALEHAEDMVLDQTTPDSMNFGQSPALAGDLKLIASLVKGWPAEDKPDRAIARATRLLVDEADQWADRCDYAADVNVKWTSKLRRSGSVEGGLVTDALNQTISVSDARYLRTIKAYIPKTKQSGSMSSVYSLLEDACRLGGKCRNVVKHPASKRSSSKTRRFLFSPSQVSKVNSTGKKMQTKVTRARRYLKSIKAKYDKDA